MRILHISEPKFGGVNVVLAGLARHQLATGHEVGLAVPVESPVPAQLASAGARHLPWEAIPQPGPAVPGELRALARILREFRPDLVHLHSSKAGLAGRLLIRGRVPTILQPHSWPFFVPDRRIRAATVAWERFAARWTDAILCVSADERRLAEAEGIRADLRVLPNGVDLVRFERPGPGAREAARARLGMGAEPLVVCAARLHRQKNQGALLDAWPTVRAAVADARLVLLGDGPDHDALAARQVEGVELAGAVDDVRPWYAAASLVAQPSLWEGMSLSLLEAMASARSAVVTDVPGMAETVTGGAGAVVPLGDASALAHAIAERLADHGRADAEGAVGRRRVEEHHDLADQHAGVDALYADVLKRPAGRAGPGAAATRR